MDIHPTSRLHPIVGIWHRLISLKFHVFLNALLNVLDYRKYHLFIMERQRRYIIQAHNKNLQAHFNYAILLIPYFYIFKISKDISD